MKAWQFKTSDIETHLQREAWTQAMSRLHLPVGQDRLSKEGFKGSVSCIVSPLGIELALVEAESQEIAGRYPKQDKAIWLTVLLEGKAQLTLNREVIDLQHGDMIYGPTGDEHSKASLDFFSEFRQLFVKVPQLAISPRLVSPLSIEFGYLSGSTGVNHVLSGLLRSLAAVIDDVTEDELRPLELSLTELLFTCLASKGNDLSIGAAAQVKTLNMHSICQTIETLLSNSDLSPAMVAREHGISVRYLQKLFTMSNKTFSNYVRVRRLERCHADLTSPLYAQLSITEICFRWGFNSSAYFSRSFSEHYQISPRECRRQLTDKHDN